MSARGKGGYLLSPEVVVVPPEICPPGILECDLIWNNDLCGCCLRSQDEIINPMMNDLMRTEKEKTQSQREKAVENQGMPRPSSQERGRGQSPLRDYGRNQPCRQLSVELLASKP